MKTKHTPTPWAVVPGPTTANSYAVTRNDYWYTSPITVISIEGEYGPALAEKVALSLNSHDALVAALNRAAGTAINLHCGLQATAHMDPNDSRVAVETGRVVKDLLEMHRELLEALRHAQPDKQD